MKKYQLDEIETILKKLTRIEFAYFRDWLMAHYPIMALAHNIDVIIETIDGVGAEYNDVINILNNIGDHSKWEIEESIYIEEENDGTYFIYDVQEILENFSEKERKFFEQILRKKYPIYKNKKELDWYFTTYSFGETDYPSWKEAFSMLKEIKSGVNNKK